MTLKNQERAAVWLNFVLGSWSKAWPTEPGSYMMADYEGEIFGPVLFIWSPIENKIMRLAVGRLHKEEEMPFGRSWIWSAKIPAHYGLSAPPHNT